MARLAWIASEVSSATGLPKEKIDTAEASIRPGSGVMCFGSMILSPLNSNVKMFTLGDRRHFT